MVSTPLLPSVRTPVRLGLTGGIGSGKSTVAARLALRGAVVVDADRISRSLTAAAGAALPEIIRSFGPGLIDASGALDRARMRELVFQQPDARQRLEAIIHPLVARQTAQEVDQATAAGCRLIVHDIPLLVESGRWPGLLDAVLVVDCRPETQIVRVMARNGLSREAVASIIATQASRAVRLAAADWVLYNDEAMTIEALHACTDRISAWFGL
ncbi:Dephospho-CoA kinase [Delftia tsuruhatensis]|uniref:dephospho-CoA kinase n=1 Tax=Delftia tsuruhatensis TaxID=180282 RepID=UPI001E7E1317|nr:dephospho-CoA kinase [Delftia tsuruhatensis]CAB5666554.1 Dephospho-CoA kinase [Delftia tsuruhatensis]CAC9677795.1 Dephospho-CoA kinase [Delftia tsuruhatensis]